MLIGAHGCAHVSHMRLLHRSCVTSCRKTVSRTSLGAALIMSAACAGASGMRASCGRRAPRRTVRARPPRLLQVASPRWKVRLQDCITVV